MLNIGNCIIKCLLSQTTSSTRIILNLKLIYNLIAKYWIIQCQTKSYGVGGLQICFRNLSCLFISVICLFRHFGMLVFLGVLWNIPIVIPLHFQEEHLALWVLAGRLDLLFNKAEDVVAEFIEFRLNFPLVICE
jgi:hypothetical protein